MAAMEEEYLPDTTQEYDELHNVQGVYNLPKGERKGYHAYDYVPQYYIQNMERLAREQHSTARYMHKPFNAQAVTDYYIGSRHYSPATTQKIIGAIEGKIHRAQLKPTANEMAFTTKKQRKAMLAVA